MRYILLVNRWQVFVLTALFVVIGGGLWFTQYLNLNLSLSSRFMKDDSQMEQYREFQKEFGPEPLLSIVWKVPGQVFEEGNLHRLKGLTDALSQIGHIDSLISITSLPGQYDERTLADKELLLRLPLARKLLLGSKGKRTVVLLFPTSQSLSPSEGMLLVKEVEKNISDFIIEGEEAFVTGPLAMQSKAIEYSRQDLFKAGLGVLFLIFFLFGITFKTWRAVASALLISATSLLGACAVLALLQIKLSQFALVAFPILAIISLQDVIHLLENFREARKEGASPVHACSQMVTSCWTPCLWTTLTTVAAFFTLIFSQVEQIRSIGLVVLIGAPITHLFFALTLYFLKSGIPENVKEVVQKKREMLKMVEFQEDSPLKNWVSEDFTKVRIHVRLMTNRQKNYDSMMKALNYLSQRFKTVGVDVSWNGFSLLYKEMEKKMLSELTRSFFMAYGVISIMMIVLFRSLFWGVVAMMPNLLPIAVIVGIMGWAGIPFTLGLIILPAVGLGLIVDDTIHIVWNLRRFWLQGLTSESAVKRVYSTTGRALILTSVILASGFAALFTSQFQSNVQLALFMPLLLLLALLFDLVGVPALLFLIEKKLLKG